jgi:hypothetical protein
MEEYLNSRAMLAPGVAGATTTTIAGTMSTIFGWPGSHTALTVSFLLGMVVFSDKSIPVLQRLVFYLVNSMIIFSVAVGLNTAGAAATRSDEARERHVEAMSETEREFFKPWF